MQASLFVMVAVIVSCCAQQYPGYKCVNVTCPLGFQCVKENNSMGKMVGKCIETPKTFQCPMNQGGYMQGFKRCGNGMGGCDEFKAQKCCYGVCMTAASLVTVY